jgi:phosphopantothenate---cysteine ligase (ATP)
MDTRRLCCLIQGDAAQSSSLNDTLIVFHIQLETDPTLLIPKARTALQRYGHQVVIGNDLNRRKYEVVFVYRKPKRISGPSQIPPSDSVAVPLSTTADADGNSLSSTSEVRPPAEPNSDFAEQWLRIDPAAANRQNSPKEIEEDIIAELVRRHEDYIEATTVALPGMSGMTVEGKIGVLH